MNVTRRRLVSGAIATLPLAFAGSRAFAQSATTLKISHQFPGGTIDQGDFRDRLVRKFAADVEKRTNGALKFDIYPNSSLVKVNSQFSALRRGALDCRSSRFRTPAVKFRKPTSACCRRSCRRTRSAANGRTRRSANFYRNFWPRRA